MGDGDRPDYHDREKKSFSELDRMRRERRDGRAEPRGPRAEERARREKVQALSQAESLFSTASGAEREKLAAALLDARGTPALADACRAYRDAAGLPTGMREISCFLDADAPDVLVAGLEAARAALAAGGLEATRGLRSQLRMLADHADDDVADGAEALLDGI